MRDLTFEEIEHSIAVSPALDDVDDVRDYQLDDFITAAPPLPDNFSLRREQTPVRSQGTRGTCSAHAAVAVAEFFNSKEYNEPELDLSEEYLYKRIKQIDLEDYSYDGYGAYSRSAAKAYQKYGACLESSLPYSPAEKEDYWKRVTLTQAQNKEAQIYKASTYARVERTVEAIKIALVTTRTPLLFGVTLYESYREARTDGNIPVSKDGERKIGGHLMELIGYRKGWFELKNSWGESWGDHGYVFYPFSALKHAHRSVWSFLDALDPETVNKQKLAENRKQIPEEWGEEALLYWDRCVEKGILGPNSKPFDTMSKLEWAILKGRAGEL